ncbi:MAG: hypothetical protein L3J08_08480 [Flavobacteriaceae bacterium]|nr:hypothetical protein [Flavobacteriaceae bacterium]
MKKPFLLLALIILSVLNSCGQSSIKKTNNIIENDKKTSYTIKTFEYNSLTISTFFEKLVKNHD